jgi:hypothetical protein
MRWVGRMDGSLACGPANMFLRGTRVGGPYGSGPCTGCQIEFQAAPTTSILLKGRRGPFMNGPPIDLLGLFGSLDALNDCMRFFGEYYVAHEEQN